MSLKGRNILAIDDTDSIRTFLRISLQGHGAQFYEAATANEGLELCQTVKPDLVVLDLGLPDRDGLEILPDLKAANPAQKIIILSVRKIQSTKDTAFSLGADAYITKPFLMDELLEVIEEKLSPTPAY